ncbi:hypothetical protein SUDANB121_01214 [Nocardiopsis dassonvillei]|uniref:hypothetical protein n=1 Tax=Nocardiopsis dassonvillei TaxID=2014 RepID=UPI003F55F7E3
MVCAGADGGGPDRPRVVPEDGGPSAAEAGADAVAEDGDGLPAGCPVRALVFEREYGHFEESLPMSGWGMGGRASFAPPSEASLAGAAAETVPLRDLLGLARWVAPEKPLTPDGALGPDDVRAAVEELGLWPAVSEEAAAERADRLRRLRGARDLPEFAALWRAAVDLEVIEADSGTARPAAGIAGGDPEELLDVWEALFLSAVEGDELPGREVGGEEVLSAALCMLQEMPRGAEVPLMDLVDLARDLRRDRDPAEPEHLAYPAVIEAMYAGVVRLARAGAVRLVGRSPAGLLVPHRLGRGRAPRPLWPGAQETMSTEPVDGAVALTALGRYGARLLLPEGGPPLGGVPAPRVGESFGGGESGAEGGGEPGADGAARLLDSLSALPLQWHAAEVGPWLAGRTDAEAVREIAAATGDPTPLGALRRTIGVSVLSMVGDGAAPELRALLASGRPEASGLAAGALMALPGTPPEEHRRLLTEYGPWWAIDTVSGLLALGEEHLAELLDPGNEEGTDPLGELLLSGEERVGRVDHPAALPVLDALGRLHPDEEVAAAARQAADRVRARRG